MDFATESQRVRFLRRIRKPGYWLEQLPHVLLGFFAWLPPVLAFVLYREIRQAATGDGEGRPSLTTGWLDPLTDLAFYVLGSMMSSGLIVFWMVV